MRLHSSFGHLGCMPMRACGARRPRDKRGSHHVSLTRTRTAGGTHGGWRRSSDAAWHALSLCPTFHTALRPGCCPELGAGRARRSPAHAPASLTSPPPSVSVACLSIYTPSVRRLSEALYRLSVAGCRLQAVGCRLSGADCRLQAVGYKFSSSSMARRSASKLRQ